MENFGFTIWILLLPLLSFLVVGLIDVFRGKDGWSPKVAGLIGTCSLGAVTVLSYVTAFMYFGLDRVDGVLPTLVPYNFTWLPLGNLHFDLGILLDPISVMMLVVISTVSLMVHIYSFGYMHGEKGFQRYYAFLSLFTMSMLGLVLATNIFQMYMFWELVGVSSYLLIGFYYTLNAAIHASKKAFIVTRFADGFFLVGILIFGYYTGSFNFTFANGLDPQVASEVGMTVCNAAAASKETFFGLMVLPTALVLMFIGGAGKSAMFPLHIWLPDAMEGPTPVSALIHAATMVVAGVFQIARMFPLWIEYAPQALSIVVVVGAFTAFYAAAVACAQSDIKRGLAFSTISQIAFMMVALGACTSMELTHHEHGGLGYLAGMFHLFTHAMFKACLFLCAGVIIHAVHTNEMSAMGSLRKFMPITNWTFFISCLAISGIPFFSGFSSKDEIISACMHYSPVLGWFMTGVAAMTAFYMFRLYYCIFWGSEANLEHHEHHHVSEHGFNVMTFPLIFLTVITVGVGVITTLSGFGLGFEWASFGNLVTASGEAYTVHFDTQTAIISTVVACCSIGLATFIYKGDSQPVADRLYRTFPNLHKWAKNRFYMDNVYQWVTHKVMFGCISTTARWIDEKIINNFIDFTAWGTNEAGESARSWQSGDVRHYAIWFLTGAIGLTLFLLSI